MSAPQQGSASFTIVLASLTAILVGAIMLSFVVYPIYNGFTASALFTADTAAGASFLEVVDGVWRFWGALILIAILSFVWINTRQ